MSNKFKILSNIAKTSEADDLYFVVNVVQKQKIKKMSWLKYVRAAIM